MVAGSLQDFKLIDISFIKLVHSRTNNCPISNGIFTVTS